MAGSPSYSAMGFRRFMDRLLIHGLEWLGLYYGVYRAEVVGNTGFGGGGVLDAVSGAGGSPAQDKQARLKIRVPAVGDTEKTPARVAYPIAGLAGKGFGLKAMPPIGAYTYVVFENGRLDIPLWLGGWWALDEMPSELESVDAYGWITPGGHKVILDDSSGNTVLRVIHSLGAVMEMDAFGNIKLENFEPSPGVETTTTSIGKGADEAAAKGDTLLALLEELTDEIIKLNVNTGTGPSTPPLNVARFTAIRAKLKTLLSNTVKVK